MTAVAAPAVERLLADGVPPRDLARWSEWTLTRVGFRPSNALLVLSVCRDELMLPAQEALHEVWGPAFDASSLAGLPTLGRTGMAAALGHTPGEDGRHRFVVVALTHVGVGADGTVGLVARRGIRRATTACGALVAALERLQQAGAADDPDPKDVDADGVDPDDVEMSLLTRALVRDVAEAGGAVPDLLDLTETTRRHATARLERLVGGLADAARAGDGAPVDHAMLSGLVVHAPEGDVVVIREAHVVLDGVRRVLPLG